MGGCENVNAPNPPLARLGRYEVLASDDSSNWIELVSLLVALKP